MALDTMTEKNKVRMTRLMVKVIRQKKLLIIEGIFPR